MDKLYYVYLVTNNINGKTYVGQHYGTFNDKYLGSGNTIRKAQLKHGLKNFSKQIIAICSSRTKVDILEKFFIEFYRKIGKAEYNIADGGYNMSPEQLKLRNESFNNFWSSENGLKMKQKLSEMNKGLKHTLNMHWYNNGITSVLCLECPEGFVKGRLVAYKHSESSKLKTKETLRKLYSSDKGKLIRKKMSESRKGHTTSDETKSKISRANKGKGRKQSEETRRKISESLKLKHKKPLLF